MRTRWSVLFACLLLALLALGPAASAQSVNLVKNGSFEEEFINGVGKGWTAFHNGGLASYGFHDDAWSKTVADGQRSQLMVISTKSVGGSERDRYVGIYQTVDVIPGQRYMFSFYGMARSTEGTESQSKWNYRIEVGFDDTGGTDPWAVEEWTEMPWGEYPRTSPGPIYSYAHGITAYSDKLTIFIRLHKKFATVGQEGFVNLDAISLVGPKPAGSSAPASSAPAPAPTEEAKPALPKTGLGEPLPIVGLGLALAAMGLTGARLLRRSR